MPIDPEVAGFCGEKLGKLDDHLQTRYVTPKKIAGCSTVVVRKGVTAHASTHGEMDIERKKALRDDTIFRIYSMSKPITSVALMMLFEEGRFQLTDPVHKFIPSWQKHRIWVEGEGDAMKTRRPESPMTIQHLLCHTSGLTYGGFIPGLIPPQASRELAPTRWSSSSRNWPRCRSFMNLGPDGATHLQPTCAVI